jgi:hypothetical protein
MTRSGTSWAPGPISDCASASDLTADWLLRLMLPNCQVMAFFAAYNISDDGSSDAPMPRSLNISATLCGLPTAAVRSVVVDTGGRVRRIDTTHANPRAFWRTDQERVTYPTPSQVSERERERARLDLVRVWGEITGSQNCRIVGKSQSVLIMIDPMISPRTRRPYPCLSACEPSQCPREPASSVVVPGGAARAGIPPGRRTRAVECQRRMPHVRNCHANDWCGCARLPILPVGRSIYRCSIGWWSEK